MQTPTGTGLKLLLWILSHLSISEAASSSSRKLKFGFLGSFAVVGRGKHLARWRVLVKSVGIYSTDVTDVVMISSEELG